MEYLGRAKKEEVVGWRRLAKEKEEEVFASVLKELSAALLIQRFFYSMCQFSVLVQCTVYFTYQ